MFFRRVFCQFCVGVELFPSKMSTRRLQMLQDVKHEADKTICDPGSDSSLYGIQISHNNITLSSVNRCILRH